MKLTEDEISRYARHIVLSEVGGVGQQKLKDARVLIVGAGGLGSPVLQYLSAAGVGTIGIVDDDDVSLSNLQRQTIYKTSDCGKPKVDCAQRFARDLNANVCVVPHKMRLDEDNVEEILANYQWVVDGCDNFETRYLLADACKANRKVLITAAVGRFDASITTLKPFENGPHGDPYPGYRDIFPVRPTGDAVTTCEEVGIVGALTGIVGSMQALETIKEITGTGQSLAGRLLMFDGKALRWMEIAV